MLASASPLRLPARLRRLDGDGGFPADLVALPGAFGGQAHLKGGAFAFAGAGDVQSLLSSLLSGEIESNAGKDCFTNKRI